VVFYQLARNLAHTEALIIKLIETIPCRFITFPDSIIEIEEIKDRENLENLTAHRMFLLTEMAASLGYRLVKHDERG